MPTLKFKTRGESSPQGKQKVYFCCHTEDFAKFFDSISKEILDKQNCSVWYDVEPQNEYNEQFFNDLKEMSLFVMPVTTNLLTKENNALNIEFKFAIDNHIPVLPLMQENGLEELFNVKCGGLQFLDKNKIDETAIRYDEKLKKYLSSVLVGDEMAKKVRDAFDAYIFLSYRKKDRKYAQELMRLIHKNETLRNFAIWYDEFLVPGEGFEEAIGEMLNFSKLFVLAVTPNIIEDGNYVLNVEYPNARDMEKYIISAQVDENTDKNEFMEKFPDVTKYVDALNEPEFNEAFLEAIEELAINPKDATPEHNFFIGLAYLGGIDVEIDHEKAVKLITGAAEAGLPEAMEKLVSMYRNGDGVDKSFEKAIDWQNKLLTYCRRDYDKAPQDMNLMRLSNELWNIGELYELTFNFVEAVEVYKELEELYSNSMYKSVFSIDVLRVKCAIGRLLSKNNDDESQNEAWKYYSECISYISDNYTRRMDDFELKVISDLLVTVAKVLVRGPMKNSITLSNKITVAGAKSIRKKMGILNEIDCSEILQDSIVYTNAIQKAVQFQKDLYQREHNSEDLVDYEPTLVYTDPILNAEELLFIALGINRYLKSVDFEEYVHDYNSVVLSIASLWIKLGFNNKAIELVDNNVHVLKKMKDDYMMDSTYTIVEYYKLLGKAYMYTDEIGAVKCLIFVINMCEPLCCEELRYAESLSEAYVLISQFAISEAVRIENLKKAIEVLRVNNEAYLNSKDICMFLIRMYVEMAEYYIEVDSLNRVEFSRCFDEAYKLCLMYYEKYGEDEFDYECQFYFCKLCIMRIKTEEYKSVESINRIVKYMDAAVDACKRLSVIDSEHLGYAWDIVLDTLQQTDRFISRVLTGEMVDIWNEAYVYFLKNSIDFFTALSNMSPLLLLPHKYRDGYSDFALITGGFDWEFIANFNTYLYDFYVMYIKEIDKGQLLYKKEDIFNQINEIYDMLIKCQNQGYAFQIFNKEKKALLDLLKS